MSFRLKTVETPQLRGIRKACRAAATRRGISVVTAPPGSGKTYAAELLCLEQRLPVLPAKVWMNAGRYERLNPKLALEVFQGVGLFDTPPTIHEQVWLREKFLQWDNDRERNLLRWDPERYPLPYIMPRNVPLEHIFVERERVATWLREHAAEEKKPLDELRASLELGLVPENIPWHAVYLRAHGLTTPGVILGDLCRELCGVRQPRAIADRLHLVHDALKRLKILLVVDEADRLDIHSLELLRDLNDLTKTGVVLLGTRALLDRIRHKVQLRPLGTRAFTRELSPPTLLDIQGALPDLPNSVTMRAWARAGGNLRLLSFILAEMGRAAEGPKRRRPSRELVDAIADRLPLSQAASGLGPEETASVGAENKAPAIPAAAAQGSGRRGVGTAR